MTIEWTCGHEVIRRGEAEPCDRPATGGVRHYEFEGEQYTEPTCDRHAQRFPLWDAIAKSGQWTPTAGSFVASAVTS